MKYIFLILLIPSLVFAQATLPKESLWVTPANAGPTDEIALNAFVYNTQKQQVTVTVSYSANNTEVATATVVVPAESAKVAVGKWTMPAKSTVVTATVTKALTKDKKDLTVLHGVLGTVSVGSVTRKAIPGTDAAKAWVSRQLAALEAFRIEYAERYSALRDEMQSRLHITKTADLKKVLMPDVPAAATTAPNEQVSQPKNDPMDFLTLAYRSTLASFFSHKAMFYIILGILALAVIRFFFSRFV
jgi:hypothetical protein